MVFSMGKSMNIIELTGGLINEFIIERNFEMVNCPASHAWLLEATKRQTKTMFMIFDIYIYIYMEIHRIETHVANRTSWLEGDRNNFALPRSRGCRLLAPISDRIPSWDDFSATRGCKRKMSHICPSQKHRNGWCWPWGMSDSWMMRIHNQLHRIQICTKPYNHRPTRSHQLHRNMQNHVKTC